jgi:ligand-binding sensor domain-containing protein/serine phosphatase RsbU (regulator of sigma subunit)
MRFSTTSKLISSTIACLFLFSVVLTGQTYSFKNFGAESNIPNGFVYTISQSSNGFLWVGTGSGISRFDGFSFFNVPYPDSAAGRYPTISLKDKKGTLWFGCSDGSVFYAKENKLTPVLISNSKSISDIVEGPGGFVYIIPQGNAIFRVNPEKPEEIKQFSISSDINMFSASFAASGRLLIGSQGNILVCKLENDSASVSYVINGFDYSNITSIHVANDSSRFIVGTDGNGLFHLKISDHNYDLKRFNSHPEWISLSIQSIYKDSENNFWISTFGDGVIQFQLSENFETVQLTRLYNGTSGLGFDDVKTVFQDIEGNYWFGLYGGGISILTSYAFGYYSLGKNPVENDIIYVTGINDKYLLGTPIGFHLFDPVSGKSVSFTDLSRQIGNTEITSYYLDKEKNLWIGTGGKGLFVRNNSGSVRLFCRTGDSGADFIKDIDMDNRNVWVATTNGVFVYDKNSGKRKQVYDINNGLPHNFINTILLAHDGNTYIGTESDRIYKIDSDFNITPYSEVMYGSTMNKVLSFSQNRDGVLWAATKGNGIFECFKDSISSISRSNDLMSNYCYSILADSENNIWVGHDKGFSRFNPETGVMKIYGKDFAKSGVCNPDAMYESADKKIFIGTTEGLIVYDIKKDRKSEIPPYNNINYILINDIRYDYRTSFTLPYKKNYTVRISYTGINFSDPEKVYYSTNMVNVDEDWTKMTTERERTIGLTYGKYRFSLISVNEEGLSRETPVSFEMLIKPPLWMRWWFVILSIAVLAGAVIVIIRERDKSQKKIQEYLENELEARTSVVMKQKGEIELQNIEITDSINYAKRIQSSILPDITKLKETFNDAFIFFHPRDIVSGDFYWFDKLEDDKFILVCADSTGHGVPGAFMSMIGSTLLQDIVTRKRISRPSEILTLLDKQIFSTLNQNVELGVSNDGMDMVVCEINVKTRHVRFASAMRPVIIVLDGEPYYIKGNRSSVGGESVIEKYFDDQEYYLNPGDTLYLFSDGLPDQFGGLDGKKMKIARLKRVIEQVSKLEMDQQQEAMSKFYFEWKGEYDQVDDILLMGVRV